MKPDKLLAAHERRKTSAKARARKPTIRAALGKGQKAIAKINKKRMKPAQCPHCKAVIASRRIIRNIACPECGIYPRKVGNDGPVY